MDAKRVVLGGYTLVVGAALATNSSLAGAVVGLLLVSVATVALVSTFGRWLRHPEADDDPRRA
jgi:hypothetical protein